MAFTYNISDSTDTVAYVRLWIDDTEEEGASFSDEEIQRVLDDEGSTELAIDTLLSMKKVKLSSEPSAMQIGATAIRQDISGRLKALGEGQKRHAAREAAVPSFESGTVVLVRTEDA